MKKAEMLDKIIQAFPPVEPNSSSWVRYAVDLRRMKAPELRAIIKCIDLINSKVIVGNQIVASNIIKEIVTRRILGT